MLVSFSGHYAASLIGTLASLGHFSWVFQSIHLLFGSPCLGEFSYSGSFEKTSQVLKVVISLNYGPKGVKQGTKKK